jgi:hypothetical protein
MSELGFNDSSFSDQNPEFLRNTPWKEILDLSEEIMDQLVDYDLESSGGKALRRVAWEDAATSRTIDLFAQNLGSTIGYRLIVHPLSSEGTKETYLYNVNFRKINEKNDKDEIVPSADMAAAEDKVLNYLKSSGIVTERMKSIEKEKKFIDQIFKTLIQGYDL